MIIAGIVVASILGVGLLVALALRTVVKTDQVHVVQRRNGSTAYGQNFPAGNVYYDIPSHIPYFGVQVTKLTTAIFPIQLQKYDAYDLNRVPFVVDVLAYCRIQEAVLASQRVSDFQDMEAQLQGTMRGAVRRVLASQPINEIMGSRASLREEFQKEVSEQMAHWGVLLNSIEFMNLEDFPGTKVITNIMDKERTTIEKESRIKVAENTREAELAEIAARQTVELKDVERTRSVEISKQKANQTIQAEAATTAKAEADTNQVKIVRAQEIEKNRVEIAADAEAEIAKRRAKGMAESLKTQAEGESAAAKTKADAYAVSKTKEAEGNAALVKQQGIAEADVIAAKGTAEAEAKAKLAEALAKMNDAATSIKLIEAMVEMNSAKYDGLAQAYNGADVKIVTSGQGPKLLGVDLNAETGADLATFIEALPEGLKEKAKKLAESMATKVKG